MAAAAHHGAGFILGPPHPLRAAPLDVDGHIQSLPVFAIVFQERPDRDVDKIVLGLPEDGSNRLGYADHQEAAAIDVNRLADGVDRGEQLAGDSLSASVM